MRIVITAGGTREYIDPVRFISNASTGKMGYAMAKVAIDAGHRVVLISAPSMVVAPKGVQMINVVTSDDMFKAVRKSFEQCDCLIMAAAVSDYKPQNPSQTKIKKADTSLTLTLEPTIDIIKWAGQNKKNQIIVGFALEDTNLFKNAEAKMDAKNIDIIIANSPAAISADASEVHVKQRGCDWISLPESDKYNVAERIIALLEASGSK